MEKTRLKSLLVAPHTTIKQAMFRLNETANRILFVTDDNFLLLGTITDGDMRRGLTNGLLFGDIVEKVMFRKFTFIKQSEKDVMEKVKRIMLDRKIEQIPVLDDRGLICDVILWTDIFGDKGVEEKRPQLSNPVVIMAGGKGTRLDPFTKILPKPLIPIGDKPIVEILMDKFHKVGFENFILTLNYKKEYIKMFIKENSFPYNISWVEENSYRGTAGSLSLLSGKVTDTFIISNCDIIVDANYAEVLDWHKEAKNLITLIGCHKEVKIPYGTLEMQGGRLKSFTEKPSFDVMINTGIYILEPEVISYVPESGVMDMNMLIEIALQKEKVSVYPIHEGWLDIGEWDEYKKSIKELGHF